MLHKRRSIPKIDVLQVSADGPASYYQAYVDQVPDVDIFMLLRPELKQALLRLKRGRIEVGHFWISTRDENWRQQTHALLTDWFRSIWPGAQVSFWTKGAN